MENFLRVLTGRLPPSTPRSKRLLSDDHSNILIYLTGKNHSRVILVVPIQLVIVNSVANVWYCVFF